MSEETKEQFLNLYYQGQLSTYTKGFTAEDIRDLHLQFPNENAFVYGDRIILDSLISEWLIEKVILYLRLDIMMVLSQILIV